MKNYFIKVIIILLFINNAYAQSVSITSNPGTPSANIIIGYSNYNVTEALYNDAEIGTNFFTNTGYEISAIGVFVSTVGTPTLASGYKIWMKNTTTSAFAVSTYSTTGYTLVFNGSINPTSAGLYKINLNTPFKRVAGNNLQIMFERNDGVFSNGFTFDVSIGNNTSTSALTCRRYNGTVPISSFSSLSVSSYRPAIQLICPSPYDAAVKSFVNPTISCYSATQTLGVVISNEGKLNIPIGAASVNLKIGGANSYVGSLTNTAEITPNGSTIVYFSGINLNNAGTNRDTATVTYAGDTVFSNNKLTSTLTTANVITSFPVSEGAESSTLNLIPFSSIVNGQANAWTFLNKISTTGAYNNGYSPDSLLPRSGGGSNFFLFNSWENQTGTTSRIYSHCITLPTAGIPRVSFWMSHDSAFLSRPDSLFVVVSNNKGASWTRIAGYSRPTSGLTKYTWKLDSADLSLYKGQTIQLGFEGVSSYGNSFGLDDITVYIAPCLTYITRTFVTSCNNYTWAVTGQTYTSSGTYIRTYTNSCGSISTDTLKLTINKSTYTSSTVTACNSYTWSANSVTYTSSGTYVRSYNNTAGCASFDTLKLTINKSTFTASNVYACNTYTWSANATTYSTSGDYVRTYTNAVGCISYDTLHLKISTNINSKTTQIACGSYNWFGVNYTVSGVYTRLNACGATDTLALTVNRLVAPTFTQISPICKDSPLVLLNTSTNGVTGSWSPAINNQITTKYTFTPNSNFCASQTSMTVTVYQPTVPLFTQVYPICVGGTFTLPTTSNNDITGFWSPAINNQTTTTYTFTPDPGQCAAKTTMTVTVNATNVTPTFTQVAAICKGSSFSLPGVSNNGYIGTWSPALNNQTTTTYTFTPASGQCANTATMTVTVTQPSTAIFTQIAPICRGGIFNLPTTSNNGVIGTWSPALNNLSTTTYTFTPNSNYCSNTVTMTVTVNQPIVPVFNPIAPICIGDSLSLPLTSLNSISGTWSPAINNQRTTTYTFTPNSGFCATTTTLTVTVNLLKTPLFTQIAPICKDGTFNLPSISNDSIIGTWTPAINNQLSTTYTFIPNAGQCANSTTMTVAVKQPTVSFDTVSSCNNYTWNGQQYSLSGTYSVNRVNASGCDSIAYLNLTIIQSTSSVTTAVICQGTGYVFNGTTYTASGTYTKILVNTASCDSFAVLNLTVDPLLTSSLLPISGVKNINKCDTLQTFSVPLYNRASYRWSVTGTGNYIKSGLTSNIVTIVLKVAGTVSVSTTSPCNTTSVSSSFSVIKSTPTTPGAIYQKFIPITVAANTNVCLFNQDAYLISKVADTFSIRAVANATGYYWKAPSGSTITRVNDTTVAIVFPNTLTLPDSIKVYSLSACDTSLARALPLTRVVASASGSIYNSFNTNSTSGPAAVTNVCYLVGGGSETYMIRKVSSASSYNWSLKFGTNAVITHLNPLGFIDTAIRITYNAGFTKDTLLLNTVNGCGSNTTVVKLALNAILTPPSPTNIISATGNYNPCIGNTIQYSVVNTVPTTSQTAVSVYRWTIPANTTIITSNADSSIISLIFNNNYTGGTLSVKGLSACGISSSTKSVSLTYWPPTPTSLTSNTGNYNPCIRDTVQYSVVMPIAASSQSPMVVLRWYIPLKTKILSSNTDSSVITLRFDSLYSGGTLSVKAQSVCGVQGTAKSVYLTHTPPTPTSITSGSGSYNACIGDTIKYTVVVSAPSTSQSAIVLFRWSVPAKTRILSANSDSSIVTIRFDSLYTGGNLTVRGQTVCGVLGTSKSQALTHTGCAAGTKNLYVKTDTKNNGLNISVFPNPTTNTFSVSVNSKPNKLEDQNNQAKIKVMDLQGRVIESFDVNLNQKIIIGDQLKSGIYLMEVNQGEYTNTSKLIKLQ